MPKMALRETKPGQFTIPVDALRLRINRALNALIPYHELCYNASLCGYMVRIISDGPDHLQTYGPYYYKDFPGLARMLNVFRHNAYPSVSAYDRKGREYPEIPLPLGLHFQVTTPILVDAIKLLRGNGYKVITPYPDIPKPGQVPPLLPDEPVTAAVAPAPAPPSLEDFEDEQQLDDDGNPMGAR